MSDVFMQDARIGMDPKISVSLPGVFDNKMSEVWLARADYGYLALFDMEPQKFNGDWFPMENIGDNAVEVTCEMKKLLGLPTIRKGTKIKIQLTVRKVVA